MSDDHEWVRRLLAEAGRSAEPMPTEVGERLDAVIADLAQPVVAADGDEPAASAPVVPMTRVRHRRWAGVLLAAAAITVGGYSVTATGALDGLTGGGSESAGDAAMPEEAAGAGAGAQSDTHSDAQDDAQADAGAAGAESAPQGGVTGVQALSSATLRRDAAALVRTMRVAAAGELDADGAGRTAGCVAPPSGARGTRVSVTYDGQAATAVVRRGGDRARVQVWSCEQPALLARVVVPAAR